MYGNMSTVYKLWFATKCHVCTNMYCNVKEIHVVLYNHTLSAKFAGQCVTATWATNQIFASIFRITKDFPFCTTSIVFALSQTTIWEDGSSYGTVQGTECGPAGPGQLGGSLRAQEHHGHWRSWLHVRRMSWTQTQRESWNKHTTSNMYISDVCNMRYYYDAGQLAVVVWFLLLIVV